MIRVLVADDQALVRDGFRALIDREADIEVVGDAADGIEAIEANRRLRPDVVLMDIRMPGLDGIEATRRILTEKPAPRILMLTTFDRDDYLYQSLRAGASGFLLKDVRQGQLTDAIRTVAGGEALLAPAVTRRLIEQFCHRPPPAVAGIPNQLKVLTESKASSSHTSQVSSSPAVTETPRIRGDPNLAPSEYADLGVRHREGGARQRRTASGYPSVAGLSATGGTDSSLDAWMMRSIPGSRRSPSSVACW